MDPYSGGLSGGQGQRGDPHCAGGKLVEAAQRHGGGQNGGFSAHRLPQPQRLAAQRHRQQACRRHGGLPGTGGAATGAWGPPGGGHPVGHSAGDPGAKPVRAHLEQCHVAEAQGGHRLLQGGVGQGQAQRPGRRGGGANQHPEPVLGTGCQRHPAQPVSFPHGADGPGPAGGDLSPVPGQAQGRPLCRQALQL